MVNRSINIVYYNNGIIDFIYLFECTYVKLLKFNRFIYFFYIFILLFNFSYGFTMVGHLCLVLLIYCLFIVFFD